MDNLPRLGALRTLDLRGNDLRVRIHTRTKPAAEADVMLQTGVTYIAQVLKRNRTLRVLNLSESKLGVQELVAIADALVQQYYLWRYAVLTSGFLEIQLLPGDAGPDSESMQRPRSRRSKTYSDCRIAFS